MKALLAMLMLLPCLAMAQDLPEQFAAAGVAVESGNVTGWGTYAKKITGPVYSLTTYDITRADTLAPIGLNTLTQLKSQARTGLAVYVKDFGPFRVFGLADAGVAADAQTAGGSFSGGAMVAYQIKDSGWGIVVPIRVLKNSGGETTLIYEIGFGWGK